VVARTAIPAVAGVRTSAQRPRWTAFAFGGGGEDIDPELVHAALKAAVCDIPEYLRHVERHVERSVAEE
jgi:hypothetical protein